MRVGNGYKYPRCPFLSQLNQKSHVINTSGFIFIPVTFEAAKGVYWACGLHASSRALDIKIENEIYFVMMTSACLCSGLSIPGAQYQ